MSAPGAIGPSRLTDQGNGSRLAAPTLPYRPARSATVTDTTSIWETPEFVEIKMDAEINSYQDDFGDDYH
jgi:coenzyme PQQ precursor peptide PqqA